jgi:hypothetical protein
MNYFRLKDLKKYNVGQLYTFRAKALLSQGNGPDFSQMLENRIDKIGKELIKRGETISI